MCVIRANVVVTGNTSWAGLSIAMIAARALMVCPLRRVSRQAGRPVLGPLESMSLVDSLAQRFPKSDIGVTAR